MNVAIVGGGILGLTLAWDLSGRGHGVRVFEAAARPGGLAAGHDYGAFRWDRFYHCIVPGDDALLNLVDELGLSGDVVWRRSSSAYLAGEAIHPMNGPRDLWRFPLLGPVDKARLAFASLWAARFARPDRLERISAERWLTRLCGPRAYRVFWAPLLRAKFGAYADRVAAVFLWATLRRLTAARGRLAGGERLGYVHGGYSAILDAMTSGLSRRGARLHLASEVRAIAGRADGRPGCRLTVRSGGRDEALDVDHVIFTAPTRLARRVCAPELTERLSAWERENPPASVYLGVLCAVLAGPRPLTGHYILNIGRTDTALTGIIEMTALVDPLRETAGRHLLYLPRYAPAEDELFERKESEIDALLVERGLRAMFPRYPLDDVEYRAIHGARLVQPLPLAAEEPRPEPRPLAWEPPFQVVNTARLRCATLNNNEVVALAREAAAAIDAGMRGAVR